jgi:mono/diheme cytochrome c family protein
MKWLFVALFTTAAAFASAGKAAPMASAQDSEAADAAGKALVSGVCASCHAADLITSKQAPRTEWKDIVDRMKGYGTNLDDKQYATLLDYLEKHHGPKQAADPGKALLETACSNCHDLDLVSNRTGTQAEWQEVVERMNGRGAGVADKDIPVLVAYLVKTYPTKK